MHNFSLGAYNGYDSDIDVSNSRHVNRIFEIWTNQRHDEFAAKISGKTDFIIKTKLETTYDQLVYAAPYNEKNLDGLAETLDVIMKKIENST